MSSQDNNLEYIILHILYYITCFTNSQKQNKIENVHFLKKFSVYIYIYIYLHMMTQWFTQWYNDMSLTYDEYIWKNLK